MRFAAIVRVGTVLIAAVAVFWMLRGESEGVPSTAEAVRSAFAAYKQAVMKGDGDAAVAGLSAGTVAWYGRVLEIALHGSREAVQHLSPTEELQVLAFRQRVSADELRAMTPRQLVAYSIAHGWVAKAGLERTELGDVHLSGNTADAALLLSGKAGGQPYRFVKEAGRWRFDQLPALAATDTDVTKAATVRGLSVDHYITALLESAAGKKLDAEIWTAPFPTDAAGDSPDARREPRS